MAEVAANHQCLIKSTQVDVPAARTFVSKNRHSTVSSENLCERWNIGLQQAKQTLQVTTQKGVRSAIMPLSRRYRTDLMYQQRKLRNQKFYTDTLIGKYKSLTNNTCLQIFANESHFVKAYPMESKAMAGAALRQFVRDYGVPEKLTSDGAAEQTGPNTEFMKTIRKYGIDHHLSEPHRPNQNRAESVIREVKRKWFRQMVKRRVPRRLWDFGIVWVCETMSLTANSSFALGGRTPTEQVTGETPDISEYLDFGFYDWVWYKDNAGVGENSWGRWLGVSHRVGNLMSYWILTLAGRVVSRTTVQRITNLEQGTDEVKQRMKEFDERIKELLKDQNHVIQGEGERQLQDWNEYTDDPDQAFADEFDRAVSDERIIEEDQDFTPDTFDDSYINKEIALPRGAGDGEDVHYGRVTKRLRDADGRPIGMANENPMLDTREYEVEFMDGHSEALAANLIAQHLYSQIDEEGNRHMLLDDIVDHRRTAQAIDKADAFVSMANGVKRRKQTTQGWQLLCQWRDGSTNWVNLKDMKHSYPVQVAEYAFANRIDDEPAFAWWVSQVIKKRIRVVAKLKSKYWQRTHKFGIRIPKTVEQALAFDRENGDTKWWDAICKEMKNVRPACEKWEGKEGDLPPGFQKIKCHFIFDIKMAENFRRKARLVANGNETDAPPTLTYSSVVSRDSVRIALLIASLNELEVLACDIQNAYLTADCREKIYFIAGPEFGSERGSIMIIKKALYGLKSSGAAFRAHLAETLYDLGYKPTRADPDVWIRPATKPCGFEYYEMMLVYVDDILCISANPKATMHGIQQTFKLKDDKIEKPDTYLGAQLKEMNINGQMCWTMSCEQYVKSAIANVEAKLDEAGQRLPSKCLTPLQSNYRPELDTTAELKIEGVRYYHQELIGSFAMGSGTWQD
ncbi:Reverse transcriptase (RNA-dependent DNA polymerase) [Fragilaria crotonensis]|nr:Reverse transcriptase (RNA-dependent DNA polymerase) [Fragilaria crotonensis]